MNLTGRGAGSGGRVRSGAVGQRTGSGVFHVESRAGRWRAELRTRSACRSAPSCRRRGRPQSSATTSPLRWRFGERLDDVLEEACRRFADRIAVSTEGVELSFRELDAAREPDGAVFPRPRGQGPATGSACCSTAASRPMSTLFALLKAGAAYVPLDPNHPAERVRYILADAGATLAVAHLRFADRLAGVGVETLVLDAAREDDRRASTTRRSPKPRSAGRGEGLCYVLYTSGTTGNPKGVAIAHPSICNFVRVAAETYGFGPGDRVYQGMSIAFDFSIEEVWVPLVAGRDARSQHAATSLFGEELADFLEARGDHLLRLRADAARLDRPRAAEAARVPDRRRGLPAGAGQALEPAGPDAAQQLRADRDDRHRDARRPRPREAGDDRQAAADLFDRHPRPRGGRRGRVRRAGRDRHRRRRRRRGLPQPARADRRRSSSRTSSPCRTTVRAASIAPATSAA